VDHDRPVTGCGASLTGAVLDIGDETCVAGRHVPVVHLVGKHEDRHTVVMVALPALSEFECPTTGNHCAGRHRFAVDLSAGAVGFPIVEPVEKPSSVTSEFLPRPIVRTGDVAVERHRHVQPDRIDHADLHLSSMTPGSAAS
jgi:hypothetical protein